MYFIISLVACFFLSINAQDTPPTHLNELLVADLAEIPFTKDVSKGKFPEPPSFNSIFKVEKAGFSLYLWPREECSVVELIGVESIKNEFPVTGNEKIVFTAMEQRVAYYVWELPEEENIKITTEMPTTEQPTTETPTTVTVVTTADATAPPTTETAPPTTVATTGAPVPTPEALPTDPPAVKKKILRKREADDGAGGDNAPGSEAAPSQGKPEDGAGGEGGLNETPESRAGGVQTETLGEKLPDETENKESKDQGDGEMTNAPLTEASPSTPTVASTAEPTPEPTTPPTTTMTTTTPKPSAKRWVFKKAEYYPYVKVDFYEKEGKYRLKVRGSQTEGNCDVSKCIAEESEISFNSTKDILVMTNSPYCESFILSRNKNAEKSAPFLRPKIEEKPYYKTHRFEDRRRSSDLLVPLNGINSDGSINKTIDKTKLCCASESEQYDVIPKQRSFVDNKNAVATHYVFEIHHEDDFKDYHSSFLIQMKKPAACSWIRLCFNKDDCKNGQAVLDILPISGLLIRPDDDKAEYLGESAETLQQIRVSVLDNKLVLRYGSLNGALSGIHTPIYLKQKLGKEFHVWLLKSAGCEARLNNDPLPDADKPVDDISEEEIQNKMEIKTNECQCFIQEQQ